MNARPLRPLVALAVAGALALGPACQKAAPPAPPAEFAATCAVRASYTHLYDLRCLQCELAVEDPNSCACTNAPPAWKGACKGEVDAVKAEPGCFERDGCVRACKGDCACADRCYTEALGCRSKVAARDTCKARLCADVCR